MRRQKRMTPSQVTPGPNRREAAAVCETTEEMTAEVPSTKRGGQKGGGAAGAARVDEEAPDAMRCPRRRFI